MTNIHHDHAHIAELMVKAVWEAQKKNDPIYYLVDLTKAVNKLLKAEDKSADPVSVDLVLKLRHRATLKSKKMFTDRQGNSTHTLQWTWMHGYRITDRQNVEEVRAARGKFRAANTLEEEGIARLDVKHAGPEAREILGMSKASMILNKERLDLIDRMVDFEPDAPTPPAGAAT